MDRKIETYPQKDLATNFSDPAATRLPGTSPKDIAALKQGQSRALDRRRALSSPGQKVFKVSTKISS